MRTKIELSNAGLLCNLPFMPCPNPPLWLVRRQRVQALALALDSAMAAPDDARADRLARLHTRALAALIETPAPDIGAAADKLALAIADGMPVVDLAPLLDDLRRLGPR